MVNSQWCVCVFVCVYVYMCVRTYARELLCVHLETAAALQLKNRREKKRIQAQKRRERIREEKKRQAAERAKEQLEQEMKMEIKRWEEMQGPKKAGTGTTVENSCTVAAMTTSATSVSSTTTAAVSVSSEAVISTTLTATGNNVTAAISQSSLPAIKPALATGATSVTSNQASFLKVLLRALAGGESTVLPRDSSNSSLSSSASTAHAQQPAISTVPRGSTGLPSKNGKDSKDNGSGDTIFIPPPMTYIPKTQHSTNNISLLPPATNTQTTVSSSDPFIFINSTSAPKVIHVKILIMTFRGSGKWIVFIA